MPSWFKTYREDIPVEDSRLAPYIVDFNSNENLSKDIFLDPLKLAVDAVYDIVKKYPPPYNLFVSGGIDSQAMLWAWVKSGQEFTVCHFDYGNDLNHHDREYLDKFITKNKLESFLDLKIIPFDVMKFITGMELLEYAKKYDTASPQILTYCRLVEQVEGTVIFSGNYIDETKSSSLNYTILGLKRYAEINRNKVVPFFFLHTPQLAYSFFGTLFNTSKSHESHYMRKIWTYRTCQFPVVPQPNKKTGFERIKDLFDHVEISPSERLKWAHRSSTRPFDFLYRYRIFDQIGVYSDNIKIQHHRMINKFINLL
jgi:hypothetical protein